MISGIVWQQALEEQVEAARQLEMEYVDRMKQHQVGITNVVLLTFLIYNVE